ncbi:hypothetical protein BLA15816_04249 [Burkholderia lata]|nr:hypothetical protein BLA15816_04249 [Burkholderia lata]
MTHALVIMLPKKALVPVVVMDDNVLHAHSLPA